MISFLRRIDASDLYIPDSASFNFRQNFVCLETFRDILWGNIDDLIADDSVDYEYPTAGTFGSLHVGSGFRAKPIRAKYMEFVREYPDKFGMYETGRYSKSDPRMISWLDLKKRYKYLIDLPGHTYSTKIYPMLFTKRLIFFIKNKEKFKWERGLRKWEHYVPVKKDLSDLVDKFMWAEENPKEVSNIIQNAWEYGTQVVSQEQMYKHLETRLRLELAHVSSS
jgi:hypothetical protein